MNAQVIEWKENGGPMRHSAKLGIFQIHADWWGDIRIEIVVRGKVVAVIASELHPSDVRGVVNEEILATGKRAAESIVAEMMGFNVGEVAVLTPAEQAVEAGRRG